MGSVNCTKLEYFRGVIRRYRIFKLILKRKVLGMKECNGHGEDRNNNCIRKELGCKTSILEDLSTQLNSIFSNSPFYSITIGQSYP